MGRPNTPRAGGLEDIPPDDRDDDDDDDDRDDAGKKEKPTQATMLVDLAADVELFHNADQELFGTLLVANHRETWPLKSTAFRNLLAQRFFQAEGKPPSGQAMESALGILQATAQFNGPEREVHVRIAGHDGAIYLDLGDPEWRAVQITKNAWVVVPEPPVRFRRSRGMLALPHPLPGGSIAELRSFLNVIDADWPLVVGFLVAALRPRGPYPVLCLHAEQGAGKSTATRVLRQLVDPNKAPTRGEPREPRDLMVGAAHGWLLTYDNLSRLPDWLSDCICRLSTGGAIASRQLFTDGGEYVMEAMRPVALNAIEKVATRGDLLDRSLIINLPAIDPKKRRTEEEFWAAFEEARPRMLGALLTAVSCALRRLPEVHLEEQPRMADFTRWVCASEPALDLQPGAFLSAYTGNRSEANEMVLDDSPVAVALQKFMENRERWDGTMTELREALNPLQPEGDKDKRRWPSSAAALANALTRLAPNLRTAGIRVTKGREGSRRWVAVEKVAS